MSTRIPIAILLNPFKTNYEKRALGDVKYKRSISKIYKSSQIEEDGTVCPRTVCSFCRRPKSIKMTRECRLLIIKEDGSETYEKSSYPGHRLPKESIHTLEQWFIENKKKPYLNRCTLDSLTLETGLSSSQVKNWISNRRRKERVGR